MRAGPLSQDNVIKMLNTQFVPVFVANAEHQGNGSASAEDKAEYARFRQTLDRDGFKYADVAFYVLKPTGEPYESLDIGTSLDKTNFAQFLKVCTDTMEVRPGPVVLPVKPQSHPPENVGDALPLHLISRGEGTNSWREFPAENWLLLSKAEQALFLPPTDAAPGATWALDSATARRLLNNFYPATEDDSHNDNRNQVERATIQLKLLPGTPAQGVVRIDGELSMQRAFYPNGKDPKKIDVRVVGFVWFDPAARQLRTLEMATQQAHFGDEDFRVTVLSHRAE